MRGEVQVGLRIIRREGKKFDSLSKSRIHAKEKRHIRDVSKTYCTCAGIKMVFICRLRTSSRQFSRQFSKTGIKGLPAKGTRFDSRLRNPAVQERELFIDIQEKAKGCKTWKDMGMHLPCSLNRKIRDRSKAGRVVRDLPLSKTLPNKFRRKSWSGQTPARKTIRFA